MRYISPEEMEEPRSAAQLLPWIEATIEAIAQREGGKSAVRLLQGGCKELVEELFPLAVWASWLDKAEHVMLEPKIGSQNYDAIVTDSRHGDAVFYVEVTQAHMGRQEYWRRLHLEREGWAPGPLQGMKRIPAKVNGLAVAAGRMLTTLEGQVRKTEALVRQALERKVQKAYPESTRLIVAFEDFTVVNDEDVAQRLRNVVEQVVAQYGSPFSHIYLTGSSRRLMITWEAGG